MGVLSSSGQIKPICFYLPQYCPTRINDAAWGEGFTDWINVARARPLFDGHVQPKLPGRLGFYDLRLVTTLDEQTALARAYGVYGFCFYYYRFGASRILETPVRNFMRRPSLELPFCLCWVNESWTRAWDGRSGDVLLKQTYCQETFAGLVRDAATAMEDERYIRLQGRPLLLLYQVEQIPDGQRWIEKLRDSLKDRLGTPPSIAAVYSHRFNRAMESWVDMVIQFPPHRLPRTGARTLIDPSTIALTDPGRGDYFEAYSSVVQAALSSIDTVETLVPGVCPDWDNSPRRSRQAHVLIGSTPEGFREWVAAASEASLRKAAKGVLPAPLIFVNAWNEWAEGAMLEPSWAHRSAYLEALKRGTSMAEMAASPAE